MPTQTQTVEIAMVDLDHDHPLFDEAIEDLQNTILARDRSTFQHHADPSSLIDDLRSLCDESAKDKRRLVTCAKRFTLFIRAFAPYFDVLRGLGHLRPDWLGWFWGMLRLVFKLGTIYVLFLEKISRLFEVIAHALPPYQQIYESNKSHLQTGTYDRRLVVLLSYVYADIAQLCLDLYHMFSRCSQGGKLRHLRLSSGPTLWRPLDSRFTLLEQRLLKHRKWFASEAEKDSRDYDFIAQHRKEYIELRSVQAEQIESTELQEQRMARRLRRIDKVKDWLSNCCAYQDVYEHRIQQRHPNSCLWFLNSAEYCRWKNAPFDDIPANDTDGLERSWHDRVLFVQAKPGFGKTFISGSVIDDLSAEAEDMNISDEPPGTAYFHFNAAHLYCTHPTDAFRALAFQLVHTHRHDRRTLDALSLLMRKTSSREKASSDDVLAVLCLLLRQHATFLVIDGVDECTDVELFLTLLPEICRKSDTRAILFSRPNIEIPLEYQKWASDSPHILILDKHNAEDIQACVVDHLNRMADQGFFGISMDRTLIPQIASISDGTFLWASLLLKFLQSPALSSNERRAALERIQELGTVQALYHHIFSILDRQPHKEKRVSADTFNWLSLSINRLCIPALQTALAITPGKPTTSAQHLSNFAETIPRLTCGLVEVTTCSVVFMHRSVKEFLQSCKFKDSHFSLFDESKVHAHLAARCLSYLAHDVPKRPLQRLQPYVRPATLHPSGSYGSSGLSMHTSRSGDSGYRSMSSSSDAEATFPPGPSTPFSTPASRPPFDTNLAFLRYASLCWPVHLTRALTSNTLRSSTTPPQIPVDHSHQHQPFAQTPYLPVLSHFLTDRLAVTAWVEASWRYSLPPNLNRLIPLLSHVKSMFPPATVEGRELRWVVHGLRELGEKLDKVKASYGMRLRENPSLIWQWDGRGGWGGGDGGSSGEGGDGAFWPVWDEGRGAVRGLV